MDDVVKDCLSLIDFAKQIDLFETVDRYQVILEETEKEIEDRKAIEEEQEKIKSQLRKLENNLTPVLKSMKLSIAREILDKSKAFLDNLVNEDIKKRWDELEFQFVATKQLLNNIDNLSKNGMDFLLKKSFAESLEYFEQIISQLQEYKGGK